MHVNGDPPAAQGKGNPRHRVFLRGRSECSTHFPRLQPENVAGTIRFGVRPAAAGRIPKKMLNYTKRTQEVL